MRLPKLGHLFKNSNSTNNLPWQYIYTHTYAYNDK